MINININFTIVFQDKMTDKELEVQLKRVETATERLRGRFSQYVPVNVQNAPSELVAKNKAYLEKAGRTRTPRVSDRELALRETINGVNWLDVEERHKAMKAKGVDIFARTGGMSDEATGETFAGDVDLDNVPDA